MSRLEISNHHFPFLSQHTCKEYKHFNQLRGFKPKRHQSIITHLAKPKYETVKLSHTSQCNGFRRIKIVQDTHSMTRTEQLAYPWVRKLLPVKHEFKDILGAQQLLTLNSTLRKSLLSLYSRLANVQIPKERDHIYCWTKNDWTKHTKYLRNLAYSKNMSKPAREKNMWKDIKYMKRYKSLCKPKKCIEQVGPKLEVTPRLKSYKPTECILRLSKPKERDDTIQTLRLPHKINSSALTYKATERIKQLSTRAEIRLGESDLKENPFGISLNALKAKPTDRVVELSQPKEYQESHTKEHPFIISPAALKAKASPRIIELSKPRELS